MYSHIILTGTTGMCWRRMCSGLAMMRRLLPGSWETPEIDNLRYGVLVYVFIINIKMNNYFYQIRKTQENDFSKCLLRHGVLRVFVSFCVLVFVRAISSWCS